MSAAKKGAAYAGVVLLIIGLLVLHARYWPPSHLRSHVPELPEKIYDQLIAATNEVLGHTPSVDEFRNARVPIPRKTCNRAEQAFEHYADLVQQWILNTNLEDATKGEFGTLLQASQMGLQAVTHLCDPSQRSILAIQAKLDPQLTKSLATITAGPFQFSADDSPTQPAENQVLVAHRNEPLEQQRHSLLLKVKAFQVAALAAVKRKDRKQTAQRIQQIVKGLAAGGLDLGQAYVAFQLAKTATNMALEASEAVETTLATTGEEEGVLAVSDLVCAAAEPCGGVVATGAAVAAVGCMAYDLWSFVSSTQKVVRPARPASLEPYHELKQTEADFNDKLSLEQYDMNSIHSQLHQAVGIVNIMVNQSTREAVAKAAQESAQEIHHMLKAVLRAMDHTMHEAEKLQLNDEENLRNYTKTHCWWNWCSGSEPWRVVPKHVGADATHLREIMQTWDGELDFFTHCVGKATPHTSCERLVIDINLKNAKTDFKKVYQQFTLFVHHLCQYGRPGKKMPWSACKPAATTLRIVPPQPKQLGAVALAAVLSAGLVLSMLLARALLRERQGALSVQQPLLT